MLWLTGSFFFVELVVGYITNSMALVADSFHMLSDVAALVIAFLSVKVSSINTIHKQNIINHRYICFVSKLIMFTCVSLKTSFSIINLVSIVISPVK